MRRYILMTALAFPIFFFAFRFISLEWAKSKGVRAILAIKARDPRDILSGRYLTYRILYPWIKGNRCEAKQDLGPDRGKREAYVCLTLSSKGKVRKARMVHDKALLAGCPVFVKGLCINGEFRAGIERYYLPESNIVKIERLLLQNKAGMEIYISPDGTARPVDILINDKSWKSLFQH